MIKISKQFVRVTPSFVLSQLVKADHENMNRLAECRVGYFFDRFKAKFLVVLGID